MTKQEKKSASVDMAGEYVLGTLQGEERDAFRQRLMRDTSLQQQVTSWEHRLAPLLETVEPVTPPADIWRKIEQRIDPQPIPAIKSGLWNSLNFWRSLGMVAATLVLVLSLSLFGLRQDNGELQSVMVVLNDQSQAGWVVGARSDNAMLRVSAVQPTQLPVDKVCQLWMETEEGDLIPLGVLPHTGSMKMSVPALKQDNRFKVSIESALYAPVEHPSEEIVFEGKLNII